EDRAASTAQSCPLHPDDRGLLRARAGGREHLRHAALPRPRSAGLDPRDAALRRHGGRPLTLQPTRLLGRRRPTPWDVVLGGATDPSGSRQPGYRRAASAARTALCALVLLRASDGAPSGARGQARSPGRSGLRDDRSVTPDELEPFAAWRPPARVGRIGDWSR